MARFNGASGAGLGIKKQSRANTVAIADAVYERVEELKSFLPEGMSLPDADQVIDFSLSIRESVAETQFALVLGAFLATLTVLLFLRRMRPTLLIAHLDPALDHPHLRRDLDLRLHDQHHDAARAGARGRRGDRRRDHRAREHRATPRARRVAVRGGLEGREPDRLRRHRGDALDRGGVPAGRVREGHRRQLPGRVRPDRGRVGDVLAVRRAHPDPDAGGAHARAEGARARRLLSRARARLRVARDRATSARSTGRSAHRGGGARHRARLRSCSRSCSARGSTRSSSRRPTRAASS